MTQQKKVQNVRTLLVILMTMVLIFVGIGIANSTYAATAYKKGTIPKVGKTYTGPCKVTSVVKNRHPVYVWQLHNCYIKATGDFLKTIGAGGSRDTYCMNASLDPPSTGQTGTYHAKVTSVKNNNGKVTVKGSITYTGLHGAGKKASQIQNMHSKQNFSVTFSVSGKIKIKKKSSSKCSVDNPNYSLAGAVYKVYKKVDKNGKVSGSSVGTLTTKSNGESNTLTLSPGKYYLYETKAAKNYTLYDGNGKHKAISFKVEGGKTKTVSVTDKPKGDPLGIIIKKYDKDLGENVEVEKGALQGAQFTIKFYKTNSFNVSKLKETATWVFKTDEDGKIDLKREYTKSELKKLLVSGNLETNESGKVQFDYGIYTVQETKAPAGYSINDEVHYIKLTKEGPASNTTDFNNTILVPERPLRGDFKFTKVGISEEETEIESILEDPTVLEETQEKLSNVKFKLENVATGETHYIYTDENGEYSSNSSHIKHSENTNSDETGGGLWFGDKDKLDDSLGALPHGTYKLTEIKTDANKGWNMARPITFTIDKDNKTLDLGVVTNTRGKVTTTAIDTTTKDNIAPAKNTITIKDTLECTDLEKNLKYKVYGVLMDKATGEALKVNGKTVTTTKEFSPDSDEYEVSVDFTFNAKGLEGKTIVVFEYVYVEGSTVTPPSVEEDQPSVDEDQKTPSTEETPSVDDNQKEETPSAGEEEQTTEDEKADADSEAEPESSSDLAIDPVSFKTVKTVATKDSKSSAPQEEGYELYAAHTDINNAQQSIQIPKIGTQASGEETGKNIVAADENQTIVDTVKYENLISGEAYTAKAWLVDKEGNKISGTETEKKFTTTSTDGTVEVSITFDASKLGGKKVVVFEEIYMDGNLVGEHKDTGDDDQTVNIPEIGTQAVDKELGINVLGTQGTQTIVDTVKYENLVKGETYTAKGWLVDAEGDLIEGTEVEKEFTAEDENGEFTMELSYNTENGDKKITVFEEVYYNGILLAAHKDKDDSNQTIYSPSIGTKAIGKDSNTNMIPGEGTQTIVDTVSYDGLTVGETYTAKAWLVDKEEKTIEGTTVTKTITPTTASGSFTMEIKVDAKKLENSNVVVYEELYLNNLLIAEHKDIGDANQTIQVPLVKTTAVDSKTKKHKGSAANKTVKIYDAVAYENLVVGKTYTVTGTLMDKKTEKPIKVNGKPVTATKTFKAENSSGAIRIVFKVPGKALEGKTTVAFERFTVLGKEVATHTDINDKAQTVSYPKLPKGYTPDTGDTTNLLLYLGLAAAAGGGLLYVRRRMNRGEE